MSCPYGMDDGAYILGALSPGERSEFERHLIQCTSCRESVASLAVLPGLLGRLDPHTVDAVLAPGAAPARLLPRVLAATNAARHVERRRRRHRELAFGLAAAAVATAVGVGVHLTGSTGPTGVGPSPLPALASMVPVVDVPVTAEVSLAAFEGGTRVTMHCHYYETGHKGRWVLRLVVVSRVDGDVESIGTWTAGSGQDIMMQAITHLTPPQISRVELQTASGITMLIWSPA